MRTSSLSHRGNGYTRKTVSTVTFIDNYCSIYETYLLTCEVMNIQVLAQGMIGELPRKSLPAMPEQLTYQTTVLHHCLTESPWSVTGLENGA